MKKLFKFLPIALFGICLVLNSCSENLEEMSNDELSLHLAKFNLDAVNYLNGDTEKDSDLFVPNLYHPEFFKNLKVNKNTQSISTTENPVENLSSTAITILTSLNEVLNQTQPYYYSYLLNEYSSVVENSNLSNIEKEKLITSLSHLSSMAYDLSSEVLNKDGLELLAKGSWAPCGHRDCFDCCMYRELGKKRNWLEGIGFILTFPENLAWMAGSCIVDCN